MPRLVLLRHGQSQWNLENRFTGWWDIDLSDKGVEVYIEPKATMFLLGTVMDFEQSKMSSGFTFKNPNQTGECGCGESVQLKPADLKAIAEARAGA